MAGDFEFVDIAVQPIGGRDDVRDLVGGIELVSRLAVSFLLFILHLRLDKGMKTHHIILAQSPGPIIVAGPKRQIIVPPIPLHIQIHHHAKADRSFL